MKPRSYQTDIANRAADIVRRHGLVYLAMQVRTGKTATALLTAEALSQKSVLFVTKKKVIDGIIA
ncbi:MAG: DEAD/DEAH box helicase family protein, partial [Bacteroidota bacterium]